MYLTFFSLLSIVFIILIFLLNCCFGKFNQGRIILTAVWYSHCIKILQFVYSLIYWQIVRFFSSSISVLSMADPCLITVFLHVLFWWVPFSLGCVPSSGFAMLKGRHIYSLLIFTVSLLPEVIIAHYFLLPVCENSSLFTAVIVRFPAFSQSEKYGMLCICRLHLHFLFPVWWTSCPLCSGP